MAEILKRCIWKMTKRRKLKCKQSCIETGFQKTIHIPWVFKFFHTPVEKKLVLFLILSFLVFFLLAIAFKFMEQSEWEDDFNKFQHLS